MCSAAAHLHERCVYRLDCCCVSSSYTTTARITSETNDGLSLLINNVLCVRPPSRPHKSGFILSYDAVAAPPPLPIRLRSRFSRPVLRCWKHKHWSLLFVRSKPVEQLSPTQSPSDWEAKFERKKSQPGHVGTQSPAADLHSFLCFFFFVLLTPAFVLPPVIKDERSVSQVVQGGQQRRAAQAKWVPPPLLTWTWGADQFSESECFLHQATPAPCRETFYIRGNCLSPTTGSVSTPKSLAKTPRYSHSCLRFMKNL